MIRAMLSVGARSLRQSGRRHADVITARPEGTKPGQDTKVNIFKNSWQTWMMQEQERFHDVWGHT